MLVLTTKNVVDHVNMFVCFSLITKKALDHVSIKDLKKILLIDRLAYVPI